MGVAEVLSGASRWSCEASDCLSWLRGLPDDSVDLLVSSPPYLSARSYGRTDVARGLEEWVAWMVEVVRTASPKVTGLIAINCEGQTKDYAYQPAPFLLAADLHRAGFNLRKPVVFHRVGIPGSGGPDWLRNDNEPVICVTRPGRLPWSDNTACGEACKYGPGGAPSHRTLTGDRVNTKQSSRTKREGIEPQVAAAIAGQLECPPGTKLVSQPQKDGTMRVKMYRPPEKANPGNVVQQRYTAKEVADLMGATSDVLSCTVGGGQMGHPLSHENEAPFPTALPEFFIRSFCRPGGVVADCFCGSGSTLQAAVEADRRGIGCDLRESQVELTKRRLSGITPGLWG